MLMNAAAGDLALVGILTPHTRCSCSALPVGNKNCEIVRCHYCTRKPNSFYCRLFFSTGKKSPGGAGTHTGHTYRY